MTAALPPQEFVHFKRAEFSPTPPLKWAGGKRWLVHHLRDLWQDAGCQRLVEPMCGGLSVALGLRPRSALLNDINPHAINFYRQLQRGLVIDFPLINDRETFLAYRVRFNDLIRQGKHDTVEAAGLFYYLNRTGYNGLCRFNRRGEYNVPFGQYKTINYLTDFRPYASVLSEWTFEQGDFSHLQLEEGDFVYADPPYDVEFTQYSKEGFDWAAQQRLAEWLAEHPGPVVLSNQATDAIIELYGSLEYEMVLLDAPRRISCTGDRTPAQEVLALRNL